jgi:cation transport ATPase
VVSLWSSPTLGKLVPSIASYAFLAAMLVGLVPIARRAFMAALAGTPFSIEMLMTIAAVGAVIIGAGEEAAAVVFLFLIGELLEGVAAGKARASIQSLNGPRAENRAPRREWPNARSAGRQPGARRRDPGAAWRPDSQLSWRQTGGAAALDWRPRS